MSNFESFWICNKGEKTIFEKLTKTFGSPFTCNIQQYRTEYGIKIITIQV
jgi:hypothetical protein